LRLWDKGLGSTFFAHRHSNFKRLTRYQRPNCYAEKRVNEAISEARKLIQLLNLPKSVLDEIAYHYRRRNWGGRDTHVFLGALCWMICRQRRISRTEREVAEAIIELRGDGRVGRASVEQALRSAIKKVSETLGLHILPASPQEYLWRWGMRLGLSDGQIHRAHELLSRNHVSGKSPFLLAVTALWVAGNLPLREVAGITGASVSAMCLTARKFGA
jgi:transcription initiation factor TFIIIB Brf1 subunit/transcription initiation factor TFIIB